MSTPWHSRKPTASFAASTTSSVAKRQASSSASENYGKTAVKHLPKKRAPLADVTNNNRRSTANVASKNASRTTSSASSSLVPCSTKAIKIEGTSGNSFAGKSSVESQIITTSKMKNSTASSSCTSNLKGNVSPLKSDIMSIAVDDSMSNCDSFKSIDLENDENDELSQVNSIRRKTASNLFISDGESTRYNTCTDMETDEEHFNADRNTEDPQLCASIACDIYKHLRESEVKKQPSTEYMELVQNDINASMRAILIDWLVEVAEEYKLVPDTLFLAVNYIDRYLSGNAMNRQKLQLLGVACMMIAAKYEEICAPQVEEFCYITDNTYFREEVLEMESSVLNYLKFEMTAPTAKCFMRRFVRVAQDVNEMQNIHFEYLANYIIELTLPEYNMLIYAPSRIAASAIFLTNFILFPGKRPWNQTLQHYTLYRPSDLRDCVKSLHDLCIGSNGSSLSAIREKYNHHKYKFVSKKYCPPSIPPEFFRDECKRK